MEKSLKASPLFFIEKNKERILMKNSKGVVFKRQQEILKLLQEHRQLSVEELSSRLEVSEITIRRDLQRFEDQGLIERFYGGAKYITGKIEKVYENSALLTITDYADQDRQNASELNFKIVANFHAMTKNLGGGTVLAFPPETEEDRKK